MIKNMMNYASWKSPSEKMIIKDNIIHIWRSFLFSQKSNIGQYWQSLSLEEQQKASLFHFQKDLNYFICRRGILRSILSRYLNSKPNIIKFNLGEFGKPFLSNKPKDNCLNFNLSFSEDLLILAISLEREVGIDIEKINAEFPVDEVARQCFSQAERSVLKSVSQTKKHEIFFSYWTRKEAYLKAIGKGFSHFANNDDNYLKDNPSRVAYIKSGSGKHLKWWINNLVPYTGYIGAIAAEKKPEQIKYIQFQ